MTKQGITSLVLLLVVLLIGGFLILRSSGNLSTEKPIITNFEECAKAGYPVAESYPRECRTPDGGLFVEKVSNPDVAGSGGCYVGGCSSQICSDQKDAVSTCEFRQEYACYQNATCERQSNGQCGWTQTEALSICLNAPTK